MKTYTAEYSNKDGKIFNKTTIEANNLKEAWTMAQHYKNNTPEILQAGRVRTSVACTADILKKLEKSIRESEDMQKKYKELRAKGQMPKIDFLETLS